MELTVDVLDDVLQELQTSQDLSNRPVINMIRSLSKEQLDMLRSFSACDGRATYDQLAAAESVFGSHSGADFDGHLRRAFDEFVSVGILSESNNNGYVSFNGDDFDRIYCKYLARKYRVSLSIASLPYRVYLKVRLTAHIAGLYEGNKYANRRSTSRDRDYLDVNFAQIIANLNNEEPTQSFPEEVPELASDLYWAYSDATYEQKPRRFILFELMLGEVDLVQWFIFDYESTPKSTDFEDLQLRIEQVGGKYSWEAYDISPISHSYLISQLTKTKNLRLVEAIAMEHEQKAYKFYLESEFRDIELAAFHGGIACQFGQDPSYFNNYGYLLLAQGNVDAAKDYLLKAIENYGQSEGSALPVYNLGITLALCTEYDAALHRLDQAIELAKVAEDDIAACLFVLTRDMAGQLSVKEEIDVSILDLASRSRELLEHHLVSISSTIDMCPRHPTEDS